MGLYATLQTGLNIYDGMSMKLAINCECAKYSHFNEEQKLQMEVALTGIQAKSAKQEIEKIKKLRGEKNAK